WLASYTRPDLPRTTSQRTVRPIRARLEVLRGRGAVTPHVDRSLRIHWGAALDRSFRWSKDGPQTVESRSAFSLGPVIRVTRAIDSSSRFHPEEISFGAAFPLTGLATSGQFGAQASARAQWKAARVLEHWLGV